jgi:PKD repeat protein
MTNAQRIFNNIKSQHPKLHLVSRPKPRRKNYQTYPLSSLFEPFSYLLYMKLLHVLFAALLVHGSLFAAEPLAPLQFQSGPISLPERKGDQIKLSWERLNVYQAYKHFMVRFEQPLTQAQFNSLQAAGLQLDAYIPHKAYLARAKSDFNVSLLIVTGANGLAPLPVKAKLDPDLVKPQEYRPYEYEGNKILVSILPWAGIDAVALQTEIWKQHGFSPVKNRYSDQLLTGYVHPKQLRDLAKHQGILYIEPASPLGDPEDREGRSLHRSHTIDNLMSGGRRYSGEGIVMGIADDGAIGPHIDFTGRVTQYTTNFALNNTHGDMVAGIAVGAANLDPTKMGMAPGTYLHMYGINGYPHVVPAVANYNNLGTTITSTSYSEVNGGLYNANAATVDDQIRDNPMLMHVFSAGNAGTANHNYGAGAGWGNITGGYKAGKNVMAVGNLRNTDSLENSSSRGPARDGRIKPDICANGWNQLSTGPNNTYLVGGGTSAASPGIAGIFAQLSQAYRSLNNDSVPPSALLKACMLNTAEDLGNPGPDFRFGWGRINALRAVQTLEDNRFQTGTISQGDSLNLIIDVPANVKELRVMLYWADKAGVPNAAKALVNNLDLELIAPGNTTWLPWVLNPTPTVAALTSPAVRSVDTLNNAEQVTLTDPTAGIYTARILGTQIPFGPQRFWLVYEWYTEEITVTYPMGGEGFVPGETELIRWDAIGVSGTYTVQFSTDNGQNWTNIATNLPNNRRHHAWNVPNQIGGQVRVRVTNGTISGQSAQSFSIAPLVGNIGFGYICNDSLGLTWSASNGATGYIVYRLGARYMDSIGQTSTTNFTVTNTALNDSDWFAVQPIGNNGLKGRRSLAVPKPRNTILNCQAPPTSNFSVSNLQPCLDQEVQFTDESMGIPTSWRWSISPATHVYVGGTTDTSQNPMVEFGAAGAYQVQLITSNQFGSDTLVRPAYLQAGIGQSVPFNENFTPAALPANWSIENPDNASTWQFRTGVGRGGANTGMSWMNFFSYNASGQLDYLYSPVIDLSGVNNPFLAFDVAYARFSATLFDGLRIEISENCGGSYDSSVYFKQNLDLATAGTITTSFTPNASQWRRDTVDLSAYTGKQIRLKFTGICGYGNNLYLANVEINSALGMIAAIDFSGPGCLNNPLQFNSASTGNISSFSWNFGVDASPATANTAGPHQVTYSSDGPKTVILNLTGPGGNTSASELITISEAPIAAFSQQANGLVVDFSSQAQHAARHLWDFGDGNTSTDANPTHSYAVSGGYEVRLIVENNCSTDTLQRTIAAFATSVHSVGRAEVTLYPNPAQSHFVLQFANTHGTESLEVTVRDASGRVVLRESRVPGESGGKMQFDVATLAAGWYQVQLLSGHKNIHLPLIIRK